MRAYAYIGDTGGPSSGSVDINSITVNTVPLPSAMLLGSGLLGLAGPGLVVAESQRLTTTIYG